MRKRHIGTTKRATMQKLRVQAGISTSRTILIFGTQEPKRGKAEITS